jgi:hypothetical protein
MEDPFQVSQEVGAIPEEANHFQVSVALAFKKQSAIQL